MRNNFGPERDSYITRLLYTQLALAIVLADNRPSHRRSKSLAHGFQNVVRYLHKINEGRKMVNNFFNLIAQLLAKAQKSLNKTRIEFTISQTHRKKVIGREDSSLQSKPGNCKRDRTGLNLSDHVPRPHVRILFHTSRPRTCGLHRVPARAMTLCNVCACVKLALLNLYYPVHVQ